MRAVDLIFGTAVAGITLVFSSSHGIAQQVTGVLGSPGATTTINVY